ncbi:protein of unknown function DUF710 [Thermosinus carboxydivorans Nor1]|uniref:Cell division protein ZapA n=1 Tax=Thermosinus carboxydivorans Nor1 TaxID=401526 RepID=A1HPF7_9FIRM|nr:cell division protein ZapA [Thermosinus carboxydivorans]EAX48259.1 protein of unknown function DUF710 [Thermosinus carboxydivorans Nor1]
MDGKKTKITVEIFGETYALKGDIEPERILRVAAILDERMKKIAKANSRLSPSKVAVLAALNIADEYLRLEQDYQQLLKMLKDEK